jgi:hypothetical protein
VAGQHNDPWWKAKKGEVHTRVMDHVAEVERVQISIYDRFVKLAALYDPIDPDAASGAQQAQITENVIASNIDTVHAAIAANEVRARFMTDDGDWSTQRTARHLEWYAEGLAKLLDVHQATRKGFKAGALKGTGITKVYVDAFNRIRVEPTLADDIVVDEAEVRAGAPRQMQQRLIVDSEVLKASFPGNDEAIDAASKAGDSFGSGRFWANYRPLRHGEVVCVESWYLPIGVEDMDGYQVGRRTITIDGADLLDEDWSKPFFPFAVFRWTEKTVGWYGIGLAERITGHQRAINKMNWQVDRQLDQHAVPTTYVRMADAGLAVKTTNRAGSIAVYKSDVPVTVIPQAVSPETYRRREDVKNSAFEESGVSRMAAQSMKPAGLDSGVALREYRDQTTQRFSQQEKAFERFYLDTIMLVLDCAKDLDKDAPIIVRKSKHGPKKIPWSKVDMGEVRVQIVAASTLSKTPAGRIQTVMEMAAAGVVSLDESRRLTEHPDLESAMSLYTAAIEDAERCIEEILDGATLTPEPYQNLKILIWRGQMHYLKARDDGAPEDVLENLRQFIVQAAYIHGLAEAPAQDMAMSAGPVGPTDSTGEMPPMDPALAATMAGGPMTPDMGPTMTGAGVAPVDFLQ